MRSGETQKQPFAKAARTETLNSVGGRRPTTTTTITPTTMTSTTTTDDKPVYTVPRMPHNTFSKEELDREYPSSEAVDALPLDDVTRLDDDQLYSAGMKVVQQILREMAVIGRTRKVA